MMPPSTSPLKLQASHMMAHALPGSCPSLFLPPPCPAPLPPYLPPAIPLIQEMIGKKTPLAILLPTTLEQLLPHLPLALQQHGEGGLQLEHIYSILLPSLNTVATSDTGSKLLVQLLRHSAPTQRRRLALCLLPQVSHHHDCLVGYAIFVTVSVSIIRLSPRRMSC